MYHAFTAYSLVQPPCTSAVFYTLHVILHTSNANAKCALVLPHINISAVVVGKRCQTSRTTCTNMGFYSHVRSSTVTLCILHFSCGFQHTIRSTFPLQHWLRFHYATESFHSYNTLCEVALLSFEIALMICN